MDRLTSCQNSTLLSNEYQFLLHLKNSQLDQIIDVKNRVVRGKFAKVYPNRQTDKLLQRKRKEKRQHGRQHVRTGNVRKEKSGQEKGKS